MSQIGVLRQVTVEAGSRIDERLDNAMRGRAVVKIRWGNDSAHDKNMVCYSGFDFRTGLTDDGNLGDTEQRTAVQTIVHRTGRSRRTSGAGLSSRSPR